MGPELAKRDKCHNTIRFVAQFRPSDSPDKPPVGTTKDGLEFRNMSVKATEQKQDSARQYTNLDNRYGKIGISAVAAAVRHQGEQRNSVDAHFEPYDRD